MSLDEVFKAYDIRGVYPDQLDEALARRIGNSFAHFTGAQHLVVGYDMRPSSVPLAAAFIEGATLAGADVTDVGLASTDLVYFASGHLDAPGAMLTASHNPAQYNGIKLCRAGAAPVGEQTGLQQIRGMVESGGTSRGEAAARSDRMALWGRTNRTTRACPAQMGTARPISRASEAASAVIRLATSAHAMRRTRQTRTPRAVRGSRYSLLRPETPVPASLEPTTPLAETLLPRTPTPSELSPSTPAPPLDRPNTPARASP